VVNSSPNCAHRWLAPALIVQGIWLAFGGLFTAQYVMVAQMGVLDALKLSASAWLVWLVCAPFVVWLAFRLPFERGKILPRTALHTLACGVLLVANHWIGMQLLSVGAPPPFGGGPPPWVRQMRGAEGDGLAGRIGFRSPRGGVLAVRRALDAVFYAVIVSAC
jgi:hypothetical protein